MAIHTALWALCGAENLYLLSTLFIPVLFVATLSNVNALRIPLRDSLKPTLFHFSKSSSQASFMDSFFVECTGMVVLAWMLI